VKYGAILIDPPWRFRTWNDTNQDRAASRYYDLMTLDKIKALPVLDLAADNCCLFTWACNPMVPEALDCIRAWGFKYKTVAFTWAKRTTTDNAWHIGLGYWNRQNTEQCFLGTRGHPKRKAKNVRQLIVAPRREHSRKPDEVYARIEALVDGPYLEMFARQRWPGWDAWGNETEKFPAAADAHGWRESLMG
jgi:N6-adenosine-specific RNA methylase IME4